MKKTENETKSTTKKTEKRSNEKLGNDTTEKRWTRECPKCKKEVSHKSRVSRDNSRRDNRLCHSCSNVGENNPFYGKKHSEEHRQYISRIATSRRPEVREKLSKKLKGRTISDEMKQRVSDGLIRYYSIPEHRKNQSLRIRMAHEKNPSIREKLRAAANRQYEQYRQTEEYKKWASKKTEYELYKATVLHLTKSNDLTKLENWSKRNLYHFYELDHIYPIRAAFKNGIPAELVGDIRNLRVIPRKENRSKSGKVTIIPEHIQSYINEVIYEQN